jgi:hypothetical protein
VRDSKPNEIIRNILNSGIKPQELWDSITKFIQSPELSNLQRIRQFITIRSLVLFTPLVLVALADPERFPLVNVECQSFCPKIVTVFMSAFKSTPQVLAGESDHGNPDQSSRIL